MLSKAVRIAWIILDLDSEELELPLMKKRLGSICIDVLGKCLCASFSERKSQMHSTCQA